MKTIVVGFDGSPAAERALERAATLSGAGGRVVIVSASVAVPGSGVVDEPILDSPSPEERDAVLEDGANRLRSAGVATTPVAVDSGPAEALVEIARAERADMIIVGSTGSGYITRAIVGSTAENVVRHAPCDVLVVR